MKNLEITLDKHRLNFMETLKLLPFKSSRFVGKEFIRSAYVEADCAGNNLTRHSQSGFLVMLNNAPLY